MISSCIGVLIVFFIQAVKSAVFFPSNSAYGIFAALAVPLDLGPHRNVFISYNFEANYNLPVNWQLPAYVEFGDTRQIKERGYSSKTNSTERDLIEPKTTDHFQDARYDKSSPGNNTDDIILNTVTEKISNHNDSMNVNATTSNEIEKSRERRSLLSRKNFYSMLKQRLQLHGFNGQNCLLRLICETNYSRIGETNGFLGTAMHIMFSPSSSRDEKIADVYYKAEFDGHHSGCRKYSKKCPENILNLISTSVNDLMHSLNANK